MKNRYKDFNSFLKEIFGCRVQKISIDAGMSCPNRDGTLSDKGCIYCNSRGSGTGAFAKGFTVKQQLIQGKKFLAKRYKAKKFIAYFQSFSNTYAPLDRLENLYREALAEPDVVGLSVGTRPDCINEPVLNLLESFTDNYMIWIEYGLQTASNRTLSLINRGHDLACFKSAVMATNKRKIKICAHVILGLPEETREDMLETAETVAGLGIDGIKLHLLYVVKGTELEKHYLSGRYRCLEQEEYADLVCDFLERIPSGMVIQRLTGDPHPKELVAPAWSLNKRETLVLIRNKLEKRNTWQGKLTAVI